MFKKLLIATIALGCLGLAGFGALGMEACHCASRPYGSRQLRAGVSRKGCILRAAAITRRVTPQEAARNSPAVMRWQLRLA